MVSVIIPLFNSKIHLVQTVQSVLDQTYEDIEIIIIDDHSTDGSFELAKNIKSEKVILHKNSGKGACAARNFGYQLSSGNYIQFLDADDLLSIDKIEKQMVLLKEHPNHIAVCSTQHFSDDPKRGKITDKNFMFSTDKPSKFLLNLYGAKGDFEMVQTSAWLTPRKLIEKAGLWDENLSKDQDGEFFCRVVMASEGVLYEPNVINYYRKHTFGQNIANQRQLIHLQSQLNALNSKAKQLQSEKDSEDYKNAMALQYKFLAINAYPQFKDISEKAMKISNSYGGSDYVPVLGGRIIELLKITLGWKVAKSLGEEVHNNKFFKRFWKT